MRASTGNNLGEIFHLNLDVRQYELVLRKISQTIFRSNYFDETF